MMKFLLLAYASILAAIATPLNAAISATNVSARPFRSVELRGGGYVILRPGASRRVVLV